ncbi:MAG: hypothetical protein Q8K59_00405 [Nitrosomonas sp.]|nr:hypothetical protein [Nitrosomonas sp.]MDP1949564.1 hypothetical protein [Nitrosomonas sp.]
MLLLSIGLLWAGRVESTVATTLDFIYVNANTGEAAGGHTALRLGSTVFHFQFFPQGRFLLVRESWSHFHYVYNELRNRSVFIDRVPLTPEVYTRLRHHFTGLLIQQQQNLDQLQEAEIQQQLLTQLADGVEQLELETIGLFDPESIEDIDMRSLHQRVRHELGDHFLSDRYQQVERKLANLAAEPEQQTHGVSWAARLQGLLLEREFFQSMEAGVSLAPESVVESSAGAPNLTSEQRQVLERYRGKLATSVIGLLQSRRPDRARSLMLQTARYLIVSRSLANGALLTLDPFSSRAIRVSVEQKRELQGLHTQLQYDAAQAQRSFFKEATHPDIAYAILESSLGRLHEIAQTLLHGSSVRVEPGILLPARKGAVSVTGLPFVRARLPALAAENAAKLSQLRQQVDRQYAYELIHRNCATELLHALNSAFIDRIIGQRELGGWMAPDAGLAFIPSQFHTQIAERFPVQEKKVLPSRRLRQLEVMYQSGGALQIWLRESNTFSSTLYTPRTEDTPFLFFTDDTLLLRPILGITNILWGAASSVGGIFTLPIDGGERLHQGLRGMFYSLPELVFSNIRKGTYGFAETATAGP